MLYPSASRSWNGIYIEGQQIGLRVLPRADGAITVDVIAQPILTGFGESCRVSNGERDEFSPAEVVVHDTRLECFAADRFVPFMRRGFALDIEPGMAQELRVWLPRITLVATASKAIAAKFCELLPSPIHHMLDAVTSVAARIALADWTVEASLDYERKHGIWREQDEFMSLFDNESVKHILATLDQASRPAQVTAADTAGMALAEPGRPASQPSFSGAHHGKC